ncbi:hypothetical protein E7X23_24735, partial [Bacteroides fragilis]
VGINDECRGDFSFPDALQAAFLPSGDEAQPSSVAALDAAPDEPDLYVPSITLQSKGITF